MISLSITLFLSICLWASAFSCLILFFDSGSRKRLYIWFSRSFSSFIYFLMRKKYLEILTLLMNLLPQLIVDIRTDVLLKGIVFLTYLRHPDRAVLVQFVKAYLLCEQPSLQIIVHKIKSIKHDNTTFLPMPNRHPGTSIKAHWDHQA